MICNENSERTRLFWDSASRPIARQQCVSAFSVFPIAYTHCIVQFERQPQTPRMSCVLRALRPIAASPPSQHRSSTSRAVRRVASMQQPRAQAAQGSAATAAADAAAKPALTTECWDVGGLPTEVLSIAASSKPPAWAASRPASISCGGHRHQILRSKARCPPASLPFCQATRRQCSC